MEDFRFVESTEQNNTCPLGSVCARCSWSIPMWEQLPDGRLVKAQNMCAIVSSALMADRLAKRVDGLQAAMESNRNEVATGLLRIATSANALVEQRKKIGHDNP